MRRTHFYSAPYAIARTIMFTAHDEKRAKVNALALLAYLGPSEFFATGETSNAASSSNDENSGLPPNAVLRGWAHQRWAVQAVAD